MNKKKEIMKSLVGIAFLMAIFLYACNNDYYTDGGVLDDNVGVLDVSTFDYLLNNSETFDTLTTLIELCDLEDAVNASGTTFMAPRDYSIHNYFELIFSDLDEWPSLSDLSSDTIEIFKGILENYIIPNKEIWRDSLTTSYSYTTTYSGTKARFNLIQDDYLDNANKGAETIVYSINTSEDEEEDQYSSVEVVSSDLQSTNGVIHVLDSDSHIFGFN